MQGDQIARTTGNRPRGSGHPGGHDAREGGRMSTLTTTVIERDIWIDPLADDAWDHPVPNRRRILSYVGRWGRARRWLDLAHPAHTWD